MTSPYDALVLTPRIENSILSLGHYSVLGHAKMLAKRNKDGISLGERIGKHLNVKVPKELKLRKLSYFPDNEGKTRVIGILDYWSQTSLKPIHDRLNTFLKRIPEDCTFNQGSFHTKLPSNTIYYSFDLSNATDRLPLSLQKDVIRWVFGEEKSNCWETLLVSEPFDLKGKPVFYSTGQPMGAYSS